MNQLINDPAKVVADALRGIADAHPELHVDHENRIARRGAVTHTAARTWTGSTPSGPVPLRSASRGACLRRDAPRAA